MLVSFMFTFAFVIIPSDFKKIIFSFFFLEGGPAANKITTAILLMITRDKHPLLLVENEGFRLLNYLLKPYYLIPSRRTSTRYLETRYNQVREQFVTKLYETLSYCLTCDIWTDITNQSYLGVSIACLLNDLSLLRRNLGVLLLHDSHTGENITVAQNQVTEKFNLQKHKTIAVVSDSAPNMKKGISDSVGTNKSVPCTVYILSHIVPEAFKKVADAGAIIKKVRAVLTAVRRSVDASDYLEYLQNQDGKKEADCSTFKRDIEIQGNSTFYMRERFISLEKYSNPVLK